MRATCYLRLGHLRRTASSEVLMLVHTWSRYNGFVEPRSSSLTVSHKSRQLQCSGQAIAAGRQSAIATFPASHTPASSVCQATAAAAESDINTRASSEGSEASANENGFLASADTTFTTLGLNHTVAEALLAAGFTNPASVQVNFVAGGRTMALLQQDQCQSMTTLKLLRWSASS